MDEQRARQREAPDHAALAPGRRRASRLQLRPRARGFLVACRRERSADHRARRQCRGRLPGTRCVSRDDLDPRALSRRLRAALGSPAGDRHVGSRRTRRHDRAARYRRRRRRSVSARPRRTGDRRRRRLARRTRCCKPQRPDAGRAARHADGGPARRRRRPVRACRRRDRSVRAPDSRRRLATRRARPLRDLRAHRPDHRRARARRRSERRR